MKTTLSSPKWPSLSSDLTGPKAPDRCQSCGAAELVKGFFEVWREHNDFDGPTDVVVVLCSDCAKRLVGPHKRLYSRVPPHTPLPGVMPLCLDCKHRDGVRCASPRARLNGGEGITLVYPQPTQVHFCRRGKGVRSGWETFYHGAVRTCDGKEVAP